MERMNPYALHDTVDDSIRAGTVRIQAREQAHVVSEQLCRDNLEGSAQYVVQARCNRGNHRIKVLLRLIDLRDADDVPDPLLAQLRHKVQFVGPAQWIARQHA